ncbi:MAG: carbohydrate ABC transporter permease, partial [Chloroflexi bacterium]|nr:carbohydrate ABC transporter permease [Chloroflexota bacterium]
MSKILGFLTRTRGRNQFHITDILTYLYLGLSVIIMFGPVAWLIFSSFKSLGEINTFPPRLFPYQQDTVQVAGYDQPLPLFKVNMNGQTVELAEARRVGIQSTMVDPKNPTQTYKVNIKDLTKVEHIDFSLDNYEQGITSFDFGAYLRNSTIVTVVATVLTL